MSLQGCETFSRREVIVEKMVYVHPKVPAEMLENCGTPLPISKEEYLALKPHKREDYLTRYSIDVLTELEVCGKKVKSISKIVTDFQKEADSRNAKDEKVK